LLEEHRELVFSGQEVAIPEHTIFVQGSMPATLHVKGKGERCRKLRREPGHVAILPAMTPTAMKTENSGEFVAVTLDPKFVLCAVHEMVNPDTMRIVPQESVDDALLRAGVLALKAEVEAGMPGGRVYGESVAATLAVHIVRHYSAQKPAVRDVKGGLSRQQLRRVIEFIHANLGGEISLVGLAQNAGLSAFHFARLFKQSTGLAPHKYVIKCRVEHARNLLTVHRRPLAEAAVEAGFCDQSHFSAHFKRVYGVTPSAFLNRRTHR
jgi:AraC family transcriptional regulator